MQLRQRGASAADLMHRLRSVGVSEETLHTYEVFVEEAFTSPRYQTAEMQRQAVSEFENKVYIDCRKSMRARFDAS